LKKRLILLDLALVALIVLAGWRLRGNWLEARKRESVVLRASQKPLPPPPYAPLARVEPVAAAAYVEVAQKMLFSADRNPTVVVEAAKPKPLPAFPVARGVLNLGDGPVAILSEKEGSPHRGYHPGEKVGEFKLVAVSAQELVFEWEGQRIAKRVDELRPHTAGEPGAAPVATAEPVRPAAVQASSVTVAQEQPLGPGESAGGGVRACQPGDSTPPGTVVDGMRKMVSVTPFGKVCRWEPVK
jgi:hypothetical protein